MCCSVESACSLCILGFGVIYLLCSLLVLKLVLQSEVYMMFSFGMQMGRLANCLHLEMGRLVNCFIWLIASTSEMRRLFCVTHFVLFLRSSEGKWIELYR